MGDIKCVTTPLPLLPHTLQHSHQPYSIWIHKKISKTNFIYKVLIGHCKTLYAPSPESCHAIARQLIVGTWAQLKYTPINKICGKII